ncbi:phosphotyrosine protein phosphatase [Glycomyces buryatensis]|uniref:Phosphotyrosine protein phosphatase n=1 Tax=Glycomyces buryatensis TaxID=2570927 RepID=A0A4S8QEQ6_9ACTN|nr:phosphotyrosine protein phosphatase [Glycomyces buryatensis]THV42888.1 phosphotyrosine protein phosphatase [Glycomyces buryatensis]
MTAVFSVLHVCTGNICRSPMSERILDGLTGDDVFNHGAGTGNWHEGEDMQVNSRFELEDRGYDSQGHHARRIERAHVESSDLILVATAGHLEILADHFPEARERTFLVRQFGLITADVLAELPEGDAAVRGKALVAEAAKRQGDYPESDLLDPWGMDRGVYGQIADQLEAALKPVAQALESTE